MMPKSLLIAFLFLISCCFGAAQGEENKVSHRSEHTSAKAHGKHRVKHPGKRRGRAQHAVDTSGKTQKGKASFYSRRLSGNKMADGTRMNPNSNNAASKTLPLGTRARVTNMNTGKSSVVVIKDRGPFVKGRIVDLSPATANAIGATKKGVVPVEVTPIGASPSDGSVKTGTTAGGTTGDEKSKAR